MVREINNMKIVNAKGNPYFKLDFKKVDNSLEEALLPHHDQVTLSFVSREVNRKGFAVLKGKYGDANVNLQFTSPYSGTLLVRGQVGDTPINELIAIGVVYGPVKEEVINVDGKEVKATTQTAQAAAFSSRDTLKTLMEYSSSYSVKVYKYNLDGEEHVRVDGKQEINTQLKIANPVTQEMELTTTFNPYRKVKVNDLVLEFMDNKAKLKGKFYSIRFKDGMKIAGKQHKVEVDYQFKDGKMIAKGSVKNIYKPSENLQFFYVVT